MSRFPSLAVLRSVESESAWPPVDHCDLRAAWNPTQSELDLIHAAESARDHAQAVHRFHRISAYRSH